MKLIDYAKRLAEEFPGTHSAFRIDVESLVFDAIRLSVNGDLVCKLKIYHEKIGWIEDVDNFENGVVRIKEKLGETKKSRPIGEMELTE